MHKHYTTVKSAQQGVVIIEALIAILIFSLGVLGIVGLQAAMVKNTAQSKYRADASYIAQKTIGALWTDPTPPGLSNNPVLTNPPDISSLLPGGVLTVVQPIPGQIVVTVTWQAPGDLTPNDFTTTTSISPGSWP